MHQICTSVLGRVFTPHMPPRKATRCIEGCTYSPIRILEALPHAVLHTDLWMLLASTRSGSAKKGQAKLLDCPGHPRNLEVWEFFI